MTAAVVVDSQYLAYGAVEDFAGVIQGLVFDVAMEIMRQPAAHYLANLESAEHMALERDDARSEAQRFGHAVQVIPDI